MKDNPKEIFGTNVQIEPVYECSSPKVKYKIGSSVIANGKDCTVVEVFEGSTYHVKNKDQPYDSFIVDLLAKQIIEKGNE